jgi:hypothetical protein
MTARDLHRASPSRYRSSDQADAALQSLAKTGIGAWVNRPSGPAGGRPTRALRLTQPLTQPPATVKNVGEKGVSSVSVSSTLEDKPNSGAGEDDSEVF